MNFKLSHYRSVESHPFPSAYDPFPILLPRDRQSTELFRLAMARFGQPAYWLRSQSYGQVLAYLRRKVRDEERFDLPDKTLQGMARRISAYATENLQAGLSLSQSNKDVRSGAARRARAFKSMFESGLPRHAPTGRRSRASLPFSTFRLTQPPAPPPGAPPRP